MTLLSMLENGVQLIAAFIIFAIGFVAVLLALATCIAIFILVHKGARSLWLYIRMNIIESAGYFSNELSGIPYLVPYQIPIMSSRVVTTPKSDL
ncbi:MAG TPA: hypothetical protein VJO53_12925 [Candidatus Acidoferrales bacterium]|nr:hypothetical protein [Candidatus Acidoferrales bacterium]